jgi:hypothetical protein
MLLAARGACAAGRGLRRGTPAAGRRLLLLPGLVLSGGAALALGSRGRGLGRRRLPQRGRQRASERLEGAPVQQVQEYMAEEGGLGMGQGGH